MSRNYTTIQDQVKEEENYPGHVKRKLKAYEDAGLKYMIAGDAIMKRDIVFETKRRQNPSSHKKTILRIFRLRNVAGEEFIVYDTLEKCMLDGTPYECNILYGLDEHIEADTIPGPSGETIDKSITVHNNLYTIKYTPKEMSNILNSQSNRDHVPHMWLGETHTEHELLYTGDPVRVMNKLNFINASYDENLLMILTRTSNIEDANVAAKVLREEKTMLPEGADKLKILEAARNLQSKSSK